VYIIIKETKKKKVMGRGARDNLHLKHKQRCQQFNILQHEQQQTTYYQKKKKTMVLFRKNLSGHTHAFSPTISSSFSWIRKFKDEGDIHSHGHVYL
jgi:hypothetical protein